jgi:chaperonin GroES
VLPDTAKDKPQKGKVIAAGDGRLDEGGKRIPLDVKEGDEVLYRKYGGTEIQIDGQELLVLRESDLLANVAVGVSAAPLPGVVDTRGVVREPRTAVAPKGKRVGKRGRKTGRRARIHQRSARGVGPKPVASVEGPARERVEQGIERLRELAR